MYADGASKSEEEKLLRLGREKCLFEERDEPQNWKQGGKEKLLRNLGQDSDVGEEEG